MRDLRLVSLKPEQIVQAYPLIQTIRPGLTVEDWQHYAEDVLNGRGGGDGGIATLQDPRGLIAGLFVYRVTGDPFHGRTLLAEDFVALDIVRPEAVAQSLADALEAVARDLKCNAIHTSVACSNPGRSQYLIDLMRELGHHLERFQLCKALPATG